MRKSKPKEQILTSLEVEDIANEGKAIARHEGRVVFIKHAVPGDVADVRIHRSKKSFAEGEAFHFHVYSADRVEPSCSHFGVCGGCTWQMLDYSRQLFYKEKQVGESFRHLGKFPFPQLMPILGSNNIYYYRNKLEFTFANNRWMTKEEISSGVEMTDKRAVGFHVPKRFDKILAVDHCYLMDDLQNHLRNAVDIYAREHDIPYYELREHTGMIRNMIIRNSSLGEWMVIMVFARDEQEIIIPLLEFLREKFPQITSLMYIINTKLNSSYNDLEAVSFSGKPYIIEQLGNLQFRIGPKSFFQTNTAQAQTLYDVTKEFAGLKGTELVYDLYTGTGTIACYVAGNAKKVIGIEYVPEAIEDAKLNMALNNLDNLDFFAGDMKDILNDDFIITHGKPEVIITDPPRAGMHEDVVRKILEVTPEKIVYVSCNPATQARDITWLSEKYEVRKVQPVDMFPHTHHIENVALLTLKKQDEYAS